METDGGGKKQKKYEYLYHIADAKFRAFGLTLEESFENAAIALFNVMIDTSNMKGIQERKIELTSPDIKMLLVEWLSELLYLFEVDEIIFSEFRIDKIEKKGEDFSLKGKASGVPIDLLYHKFDTQVKAVTFHELEVEQDNKGGFWVQVVLDT
ncbi:MAG TPA: archease [Candidatus Methanoperedens sp.]|nr:archease [Candidatus Methanoperedens sp.]